MARRKMHGAARYSTGAIILHWTIAALIIAQIPLGWQMGIDRSAKSFALFQLHKSIGITILLLTVARIAWRLGHRPPPLTVHGWEAGLARLIHGLFYLLLLGLPLSGWLIVSTSKITVPTLLFGTIPWPHFPGTGGLDQAVRGAINEASESAHELMVYIIMASLLLHVAGALKHHWIDRDPGIQRMAPGVKSAFHPRLLLIFAGIAGAFAFGRFFVPALPHASETAPAIEAEEQAPPPPTAAEFPTVTPIDNAVDAVLEEEDKAAEEGALAKWAVQKGGTLGFTTQWSGSALEGRFRAWDADINFGTAALDKSRVTVRVETGSATTGQGQPDEALPGDDFFATAAFPTATFNASRFRKTASGYEASGTLMIKGKTHPITLPFSLDISGDTARMRGSAVISRIDYGIGYDEVDDIPAQVKINIDLTAKRQK
jgi:cytochrome b561/polyisoprenoid-binding protein YceI